MSIQVRIINSILVGPIAGWDQFWFTPMESKRVIAFRVAIAVVVAMWFGSFWSSLSIWFGEEGLLTTELGGVMVAFEELPSWQCWSPLWLTDSIWIYHAWLGIGIALAIVAGCGVGGRWTIGILVLWMIAWANRIAWLTSLAEPAMISLVGYLLIEPGPPLRMFGQSKNAGILNWQANATLRLVQIHWLILMAATVLSQAGGLVWWQGEAVWWMVSAGRSTMLSIDSLQDQTALVNALTHSFVAVEVLAMWLIVTKSAKWLGLSFAILSCLAVAFVADYFLHASTLASCLFAWALHERFDAPEPTGTAEGLATAS